MKSEDAAASAIWDGVGPLWDTAERLRRIALVQAGGMRHIGCDGEIVALDLPICGGDDNTPRAHQCTKCKLNDHDKKLGPCVYDVLGWLDKDQP